MRGSIGHPTAGALGNLPCAAPSGIFSPRVAVANGAAPMSQVLLSPEEWTAALVAAAGCLYPEGPQVSVEAREFVAEVFCELPRHIVALAKYSAGDAPPAEIGRAAMRVAVRETMGRLRAKYAGQPAPN